MSHDLTNEALKLAAWGFSVFPIKADHRSPPLIDDFPNKASTNEDQIAEWWTTKGANCNIGIHTTGLIVVDVDMVKVRDTEGNVTGLKPNDWPGTEYLLKENPPISITPSGGRHLFFRKPAGFEYTASASRVHPGVDIRSDHAYVVAPGSFSDHKITGEIKQYAWVVEPESGGVAEIPMAPDWLVSLLAESKSRRVAVAGDDDGIPKDHYVAPATIAPGTSDHELAALGGYLRRGGLNEREIYTTLCVANEERAGGRKPDEELRRIAKSVARYEPDQAMEMAIMGFPSDAPDAEPEEMVADPGQLPKSLLYVPGLVGEIVNYNLSGAIRQQPELALAGAISLMATMISGKVADESGIRPNLYVLGVGTTGCGKEHARKVNKSILSAANWSDLLGGEGFGSGAGLIDAIEDKRCSLFQIDEFGEILAGIASDKAPSYLRQIIALMLTLYTSSDSSFSKPVLKRAPKPVAKPGFTPIIDSDVIEQPHLSVYGTSVIQSVMDSLTPSSVSNGVLARFITFEAEPIDPYPRITAKIPAPQAIVTQVEYWKNFNPSGNLCSTGKATVGTAIATPMSVLRDQSGTVALDKIVAIIEREKNKREQAWELYTRVIEKTIKLALIYSCSRDPVSPVMDNVAIEWGFGVVMHSTQRLRYLASSHLAGSVHEADCLKAVAKIRELSKKDIANGGSGCVRERDVNRALRSFGKRREEIKAALRMDYGAIVTEEKTGGTPKKLWKVR